jgi:hypothetical protein
VDQRARVGIHEDWRIPALGVGGFVGAAFGSGPAAADSVNLRSLAFVRCGLVPEGLNESSPVRSAGNDAKRDVRPVSVRDDRNVRLLVSHAAQR